MEKNTIKKLVSVTLQTNDGEEVTFEAEKEDVAIAISVLKMTDEVNESGVRDVGSIQSFGWGSLYTRLTAIINEIREVLEEKDLKAKDRTMIVSMIRAVLDEYSPEEKKEGPRLWVP